MTHHKENPAPAGRPGTGRIEIELGSHFPDHFHSSSTLSGEALAASWVVRLGIRPGIAATVAALAGIGGAS